MDDSNLTERPSENRITEAVSVGVDTFVVACPKDMTMYTDAAKTTGNEATMAVVDVVQLLDAAVERDADVTIDLPEPVEATAEAEPPPEG